MYNFKVINMSMSNKIFNETCFAAVNEAKFKLPDSRFIPTELRDGVFCCNGTANENLEVLLCLKEHFRMKRFEEGIDFTINVLIEN